MRIKEEKSSAATADSAPWSNDRADVLLRERAFAFRFAGLSAEAKRENNLAKADEPGASLRQSTSSLATPGQESGEAGYDSIQQRRKVPSESIGTKTGHNRYHGHGRGAP